MLGNPGAWSEREREVWELSKGGWNGWKTRSLWAATLGGDSFTFTSLQSQNSSKDHFLQGISASKWMLDVAPT